MVFAKETAAIPSLTPEQAAFIRELRVVRRHTWRTVANAFIERYPLNIRLGSWFGEGPDPRDTRLPSIESQRLGMWLCHLAAQIYGEDYLDCRWN